MSIIRPISAAIVYMLAIAAACMRLTLIAAAIDSYSYRQKRECHFAGKIYLLSLIHI